MIAQVTPQTALAWARRVPRTTCTGLRMASAYACYGLQHPACRFYLVEESGALLVAGRSALFCGAPGCEEELDAFLRFSGVCSFQSESLVLTGWQPVPRLVMRADGPPARCTVAVDTAPDLWALAHSGLLPETDPDAWYADACVRTNRGLAAVHAVRCADGYGAMAYAQCMAPEGLYITAVATAPAYRKRGYAASLLSSLRAAGEQRPALLLCAPALRRFYEKRGFRLANPLCEAQNTENEKGNREQ